MQVNLVMLKRNGTRKAIPLPSKVTIIGRRHDCDLRIPLMKVSKRHCQLNFDNGVLKIRDLGSRNGTILNGKIIKESDIEAGDSIE
ncbi:MAG: FHA domain-containing protein, partial [Candidatus Brocadiia bacterium]